MLWHTVQVTRDITMRKAQQWDQLHGGSRTRLHIYISTDSEAERVQVKSRDIDPSSPTPMSLNLLVMLNVQRVQHISKTLGAVDQVFKHINSQKTFLIQTMPRSDYCLGRQTKIHQNKNSEKACSLNTLNSSAVEHFNNIS